MVNGYYPHTESVLAVPSHICDYRCSDVIIGVFIYSHQPSASAGPNLGYKILLMPSRSNLVRPGRRRCPNPPKSEAALVACTPSTYALVNVAAARLTGAHP